VVSFRYIYEYVEDSYEGDGADQNVLKTKAQNVIKLKKKAHADFQRRKLVHKKGIRISHLLKKYGAMVNSQQGQGTIISQILFQSCAWQGWAL
jgi:hypothetical protein